MESRLERVLRLLTASDRTIDALSEIIGCSRQAIKAALHRLRQMGHRIQVEDRRGYGTVRLVGPSSQRVAC